MMILKDEKSLKRYLQHLGPEVMVKIKKSQKLADIGCAKGQLLRLLHSEFKKPKKNLYGFDSSKSFVKEAKKTFPCVYLWDFAKKQSPKQKFDVVFALDVLEHIGNPVRFLKNLASLMKKESLLVLCTPNINSLSYSIQKNRWFGFKDKTHKIFYCRASLSYLLEQNGLKIIKFKTISSSGFAFYNKVISATGLGGQILLAAKRKI